MPVSWTHENLIFSAFKPAQEDDGFCILRFYENQGTAVQARLQVKDIDEVYLADLDEQPISKLEMADDAVSVPVQPYQCITLRLRRNIQIA